MDNRIKSAFDAVHADNELKNKTRAFIGQKAPRYKTRRVLNYCRIFAAVLVLIMFAGVTLYFTPTADINIDINLSVELGINRFNKVISVNALNDEGRELAKTLDIKYADYDDAFRKILDNKNVKALLSDNEVMTVTVIETNTSQSANILSKVKSCTESYSNVYCHSADSEEVSAARELGLSYGKYRAFTELKELDPDITPEDISNMTMRQIHDQIAFLSENGNNDNPPVSEENPPTSDEKTPTSNENGHHGNGSNHENGHHGNN